MKSPYSRTIFELIEEQAACAPDRPLVMTATDSVSYAEVAMRARRIAAQMRQSGVGRHCRVGLLATNRIEWIEIMCASAALGATLVPFSTWSTPSELEFLLQDAKVHILFAQPRLGERNFAADLEALGATAPVHMPEHIVLLDPPGTTCAARFENFNAYRDAAPLGELVPGKDASALDTFVMLYTSGSSNRPKAVPLVHCAVIENGFNIGERQGLRSGDRVLVSIPLFWSYGVANALPATLSHGATLVLQERFEPGGTLDLIELHAATAIYTLPAMTNALLAHPSFRRDRTQSLRAGVTIGSPQDVIKAAQELGARDIANIYGSTETYGNCCVTPHTWPLEERARCQGLPLPGVNIRIRHPETGGACRPGQVGEVEVTGYLTRGYEGDSAKHNSAVFTADGYFKTGDMGALIEDGRFVYAGRSTEMIKRSGINVSPAEVEEVLQQHPDVGLAGVTGVADASRGEIIVAFIVPRGERPPERDALLAHCRKKLSRYKVPDRLEICAALPLTPTGKLMRRELKAIAERLAI